MREKITRKNEASAGRSPARDAAPASVLALVLILAGTIPVGAEGFRNIGSVTVDSWFDGTWRTEAADVFLARILPALTLQTKVVRSDSDGWYQHFFHFGPVVNFTDTLYLVTAYGLGIDSDSVLAHEAELELNLETAAAAASVGVRASYLPDSGYAFLLPSMSWRIRPTEPLGLFSKLFVSVDSEGDVTGSYWGEADYALSSLVTGRAGFTLSWANAFGYSIIGGINLSFSKNLVLKYTFSYLGETVDYLVRPEARGGIGNALILDVKF